MVNEDTVYKVICLNGTFLSDGKDKGFIICNEEKWKNIKNGETIVDFCQDRQRRDNCNNQTSSTTTVKNKVKLSDSYWNITGNESFKIIHIAASEGDIDILRISITVGMNIDEKDKNGWTPLHHAAKEGQLDVVKFLISNGADVNIADNTTDGMKPIHVAAMAGHNDIIYVLLSKGVYIEEKDNEHKIPLHYAAWKGQLETVIFLSNKNPNKPPPSYTSFIYQGDLVKPIHLAAMEGHNDVIDFLISKGTYVNALGEQLWTPLHYASKNGHLETVKFLLDKGADYKRKAEIDGKFPIHIAAENGHNNIIEILLENRNSVHDLSNNNLTPLHFAVQNGQLETVKFLLEKGASINFQNGDMHLIHVAAKYGHKNVIDYLLSKDVNIDTKDGIGWTPLRYAIETYHVHLVKYLVDKGADINMIPYQLPYIFL